MKGPNASHVLVVVPPPEFWAPFVAIKKQHMNPKIKRPPYPHITMLGKMLESDIATIVSIVREFPSFDLEISEFKMFENKKNTTVYLDPQEKDSNDAKTMRAIHAALTDAGLLAKKVAFEPHIGVCFCDTAKIAESLKEKYQKDFPKIEFTVTHLYVMKRVGDEDAFEPFFAVPLKGCENAVVRNKLVLK
jgi:2'-5' RNA ligase